MNPPPCKPNCSCLECDAARENAQRLSQPYFETFELREYDNDSGHSIKIYVRRDNPDPCARMWQKAYAALGNSPKHSVVVRIRKPHEHYQNAPLPVYELDWRKYISPAKQALRELTNPTSTPFD